MQQNDNLHDPRFVSYCRVEVPILFTGTGVLYNYLIFREAILKSIDKHIMPIYRKLIVRPYQNNTQQNSVYRWGNNGVQCKNY